MTSVHPVTLLVSPLNQHITVLVPAGSKELSGSDKKPVGAPLPPLCQDGLRQATAYKSAYDDHALTGHDTYAAAPYMP